MADVVLHGLIGWMVLSCVTAAGWSVLVSRYKRAKHGTAAEPQHVLAPDHQREAA